MVKRAADQQEEQQRHGRVEPRMFTVMDRFPQRNGIGERDGERNRHIHIGAAVFQRIPGRLVKEAATIDQRRRGDHRRNPVEHVARRRIRA
ncbi:hypothetical protein D3C78_1225870 [compost metagenome]